MWCGWGLGGVGCCGWAVLERMHLLLLGGQLVSLQWNGVHGQRSRELCCAAFTSQCIVSTRREIGAAASKVLLRISTVCTQQCCSWCNCHASVQALRRAYGSKVQQPVAAHTTRWASEEFSRGSYSFVAVGCSGDDYDALALPLARRLLFAGEHTCKEHPDTVGGAARLCLYRFWHRITAFKYCNEHKGCGGVVAVAG